MRTAKEAGFSDQLIADLIGSNRQPVRKLREKLGVMTNYRLVDTCAAEFEAFTPYYYSSYGAENEIKKTDKKKIMILGGGPNRIGQGIEFDYCCVHASFALREAGYETVMVNSNPETVSTDYDTSDKLFFEPLTLEDVLEIYYQEGCSGVDRSVRRSDTTQPRDRTRSARRQHHRHLAIHDRRSGRPKPLPRHPPKVDLKQPKPTASPTLKSRPTSSRARSASRSSCAPPSFSAGAACSSSTTWTR